MLSPRWKKVLADLWANKTRTTLAVLSIAIGVAAVGMVLGSNTIMAEDLNYDYLAANPAQAQISVSSPFDDELLAAVRHAPGVADAQGALIFTVRMRTAPDRWENIQLVALDDFAAMRVNRLDPLAGVWPPPDRALVIENSALAVAKLNLGDTPARLCHL